MTGVAVMLRFSFSFREPHLDSFNLPLGFCLETMNYLKTKCARSPSHALWIAAHDPITASMNAGRTCRAYDPLDASSGISAMYEPDQRDQAYQRDQRDPGHNVRYLNDRELRSKAAYQLVMPMMRLRMMFQRRVFRLVVRLWGLLILPFQIAIATNFPPPTARLRDAALSLHRGGVGYYARSQFVHVDLGPIGRW